MAQLESVRFALSPVLVVGGALRPHLPPHTKTAHTHAACQSGWLHDHQRVPGRVSSEIVIGDVLCARALPSYAVAYVRARAVF
jgi:hypothetical protein